MKIIIRLVLGTVVLIASSNSVQAVSIPIVNAAQVNGSPWMPVVNLYNGIGFNNGGLGDTYDPGLSFGDTQWRVHYSERNSNVQLVFDLGSVQPIENMLVWNYYEGGAGSDGRSTKNVTVSYSNDNVGYTSLGIQTLLQQPSPGYDTSSLHTTVPIQATARYVALGFAGDANFINYGDTNWFGLNEVRFVSATVPEPGSMGLLAVLFAGATVFNRSKRASSRPASHASRFHN